MNIEILKRRQIIEALDNYVVAHNTRPANAGVINRRGWIDLEAFFWQDVQNRPEEQWNKKFDIHECAFSSWVPRVPGLMYSPNSAEVRSAANGHLLQTMSHRGITHHVYDPLGKSARVSGGIGTLKLPPSEMGYILGSISINKNISCAIPVLVSPHVVEHHRLREGEKISVSGVLWRQMAMNWLSLFPMERIPRGYLVIDHPDQLRKLGEQLPVEIHPLSILERQSGHGFLYDFVYVSVNAIDRSSKKKAADFFSWYNNTAGQHGEYLIAIDPAEPFFEARFMHAQELLQKDAYGKAQLELIKGRIGEDQAYWGSIENLLRNIPKYYQTTDAIHYLARALGIPPGRIQADSASRMAGLLLYEVLKFNMIKELLDLLHTEYPEHFPKP